MEPILDWEQRYKNATTAWERDHLNPGFNEWRPQFSQSRQRESLRNGARVGT